MRRIERRALPAWATKELSRIQDAVTAAVDPAADAERRWANGPAPTTFQEIRATLAAMSGPIPRCMYCEHNEGGAIDHFYPKRAHPSRAFVWENYLWACANCNSNFKRDHDPGEEGKELVDPTDAATQPADHLLLIPTTGRFEGRDRRGENSVSVFDLNGDRTGRTLAQQRMHTFRKLQILILDRAIHLGAGDEQGGEEVRQCILGEPFPCVLEYLLTLAQDPERAVVLRPGVADALAAYPLR